MDSEQEGSERMARMDMIIQEEDHSRLMGVLDTLNDESNARFIFLIDKNGQQIARTGAVEGIDHTSLASLTAGSVAATEGLAALLDEQTFTTLFHEGQNENLLISLISDRSVLLVVFDEHSSIGLVRLRVDQFKPKLSDLMDGICNRSNPKTPVTINSAEFEKISDDDIEALFG
jgi:predicted regulator of Ras-like GTPase activity (Roadblock/LC7/MglB family)